MSTHVAFYSILSAWFPCEINTVVWIPVYFAGRDTLSERDIYGRHDKMETRKHSEALYLYCGVDDTTDLK